MHKTSLLPLLTFLFASFPCLSQDTAIVNLEKRIEANKNDSVKVMMFLGAAWEHKYSHPRKAHQFVDRAIALSRDVNDPKLTASGYYYKSIIYYLTTKYDSALYWTSKAEPYYQQLNDHYGFASLCNLRGLIDEKIGDYEKAIEDYQQSLVHAGKTDNLYGQSNPLHNIGLLYNKTSDYKQALQYFLKALKVREQINDSILIAQSYQTIGLTYAHLGDTVKSIDWQNKAADFFKEEEDWYDLAIVYSNLGMIYSRLDDYTKSERLLKEAYTLNRQIENKEGEAQVLINLAELHNRKKDYRTAAYYGSRAVHLTDSLKLLPELKLAYEAVAFAQEGLHDFREGFYTQYKLRALADTLLNEEKVRNLNMLETRYQVREKEQQITLQQAQLLQQETELKYNYIFSFALLLLLLLLAVLFLFFRSQQKRRQEILKQQHELSLRETYITATLQSQENERKRVALDLHDGMGQLISSLQITVSNIHGNMATEERLDIVTKAETVLREMHREIRSIAFNLMPQTLIQYGLVPALKEMATRINGLSTTMVSVSSFDTPDRLTEVQEISVYRILQEWTNNVLKYASASRIEIQLVGHEDEITVTVEDDGKGFDVADLEKGAGHGWRNIQSRLNLIKGTMNLDSRPGRKGTMLVMSLPVMKQEAAVQV